MASVPLQPARNHPFHEAQISGIPSDVHLFVKNLRFLDLDLLPDWPDITPTTFRLTKDAHASGKNRIRSAEWVLYKLFDIWDSKETKSKLRPFFPALEPIQSIKLRAAFLQWLTQLKTAGILGRECSLRKSLFDECKGEKFEEILFYFSTAVLQKLVTETNKNSPLKPLAQGLALTHSYNLDIEQEIDILLSVHQSSLNSHLASREIYRKRVRVLADTIRDRTDRIQSTTLSIEADVKQHESTLTVSGVDAHSLKKQLRHDCTGDSTWLSLILSGDSEHGRDGLIERPFADIWTEAKRGDEPTREECPKGLLSELDDRVNAQKIRLEEWRNFQIQVSKRNETFIVAKSPTKSPRKSPSKAKNVTPMRTANNRGNESNTANAIKVTRSVKAKGISSPFNARGAIESTSPQTPDPKFLSDDQPCDTMDPSNSLQKRNEHSPSMIKHSTRPRSPLKSALPIRQHIRSRSEIPSTSASYSRGRPDSLNDQHNQFDAIPGSPDLQGRGGPLAKATATDLAESKHHSSLGPEPIATQSPPVSDSDTTTVRVTQDSPITQTLSERTLQTLQQCQVSPSVATQRRQQQGHIQSRSQGILSPFSQSSMGPLSPPTPESSRPGTAKTTSTAPETPTTAGLTEGSFRFPPSNPVEGSRSPSPTRKSPARSTSPAKKLNESPHQRVYDKTDDSQVPQIFEHDGGAGTHTPPEQLFAQDADCASVFKSRSKLRHSPPGSPVASPFGK